MFVKQIYEAPIEKLASDGQVRQISAMLCRRIQKQGLTYEEAEYIIQHGDRCLTVLEKAAGILADHLRSAGQNTCIKQVNNIFRDRTAEKHVNSLRRKKHAHSFVVLTMPISQGPKKVELVYRRLGRYMTAEELEVFMAGYAVDFPAQIAHNVSDPDFALHHPNIGIWNRVGLEYSFLEFCQWGSERRVFCHESCAKIPDNLWACGVRI